MHLDANAPHHNDELMIRLCEIVVFDPHLFVFEAGGGSRCSVLRHPDRSWRRDFQEELAWGLLHNPPPPPQSLVRSLSRSCRYLAPSMSPSLVIKIQKWGPSPPGPLTFSQRPRRVTNPILHAMASCPLANGEFKGDCKVIHSVGSDGMSAGEAPYI